MKKYLAILLLGFSTLVTAQTVQTTPNLITSGTSHTWTGVTTGSIPTGCATAGPCPGGPGPIYDPNTNTIQFSYGQATVGQTIAINNALSSVGAGIKVNGYNYSYQVRNMNGDDRQGGIDTFSVGTRMSSNTGVTLLQSQEDYNTKFDWTSFTGTKTATTPYETTALGNLEFRVTGSDNGFWGGYFGPQIRNVSMKLNYTADPCAANPAFSTTCANYSTNIITSPNLLTAGSSYAINQALGLSGSGVMIHGFNYGYNYSVGGAVCTAWNQDGSCSWTQNSSLTVLNRITDNNNTIIYNQGDVYNTGATSGSKNVTYLFPTSKPLTSLGNFSMQYGGSGTYSVTNRYSKAIYTPDWCAQNPTYSATCPGYADAIDQLMFSGMNTNQVYALNTALASSGAGVLVHGFKWGYDVSIGDRFCNFWDIFGGCIGTWIYPSGSTTMEVTDIGGNVIANQTNTHGTNTNQSVSYQYKFSSSRNSLSLGNFSLSKSTANGANISNMWGSVSYTPDQCYINPLSDASCPGYTQAYYNQQCSVNPLYDSGCPGYAQALFTQQCNANQLSNTSCPGYAAAYLVEQCNANPLYSTTCSGYSTANAQCSANPLSNSYCPSYQSAQTECSVNPLYGSYCPGYTTASLECSSNPLSHSYCPMYTNATTSCSANALTYSFCPNYQTTLNTCSTNPLSNSMCPSYSTATAQCSANPLNANYCPEFSNASATCSINPTSNTMCPGYATATTECSANSLSHSYCSGYQTAQTTCSTNPLSNTLCTEYATATTSCSANVLNANYCPGYRTALATCTTNPLSNTLCSDYTTASASCTTNSLYASYCSGYQAALDTCTTNPLSNTMCSTYQTATTECTTNPLSHSYCPAYQTATTECTANPLSHSYCPAYQTATTQCAASALYAPYCPGYQFAYSCQQDGLYSNQCPNYAEAYAKKYVLNVTPTTTTTTTTTTSTTTTTAVAPATTTEAITTQLSSGISDTTVSNTVTAKSTTANADAAPAAAVKLTAPAPAATQQVAQAEPKKDSGGAKEEKKDEGSKSNANSNTGSGPSADTKPSGGPKSNREALAERRREAAVKEAVAKGKDLANEMGKANDLEAQKAVQNVVIAAMGFTPGFDTYNKAMLPDSRFYAPKIIYGGQVNVDNKNVSRRLMGGSDRLHQEMVESQYTRGN